MRRCCASYTILGIVCILTHLTAPTLEAQAGASVDVDVQLPTFGTPNISGPPDAQTIWIGDYPQGGRSGDPMLAHYRLVVLVPPDADPSSARAQLMDEKWEDVPGEYRVRPVSPAATRSGQRFVLSWGGKDTSQIENGRDMSIYGRDAYFPPTTTQVSSVGSYRQWKVVECQVSLARYNPVTGRVQVLRSGRVRISVVRQAAAMFPPWLASVEARDKSARECLPEISSRVANPQDIERFYGGAATDVQSKTGSPGTKTLVAQANPGPDDNYLIITTQAIVNNSQKLGKFVSAKRYLGYRVRILTEASTADATHYVSGTTADSRASNIRSWLCSAYFPASVRWALLIGDPTPTGDAGTTSVPMKLCWPRRDPYNPPPDGFVECPTDMFFAETTANWDSNNNGYYGEYLWNGPEGEKSCDLAVGRIPFYGDYGNLDDILQKTISYQSATGDLSWRNKTLIAASILNFSPQDQDGDGALGTGDIVYNYWRTLNDDWGEAMKQAAGNPFTLYEKVGCYPPSHNPPGYPSTQCNAPLNADNFNNEWGNHYEFVVWCAHGSPDAAWRFIWDHDTALSPPPDGMNITGNGPPGTRHIESTWTAFVSGGPSTGNDFPSFVIAASCECGRPEDNSNLGYLLLRTGAIATITATRHGWYWLGSWTPNMTGNGDVRCYPYYCYAAMGKIADALNTCRYNLSLGGLGDSWMNMLEYNVYGDPSVDDSTTFTADTPVFCVKDASQEDVAWFGSLGNVLLKGTLTENGTPQASANDEFRVQNGNGTDKAIIDMTTGNMVIAGTKHENQTNMSGASNFIIKDSNGNTVAYIDISGNLYLKGKVYIGWNF